MSAGGTLRGRRRPPARAKQLGGKLLNGPMEVPGGRAAQMMDPQGIAFSLHQIKK